MIKVIVRAECGSSTAEDRPMYGLEMAHEEARELRHRYADRPESTVKILDAQDLAQISGWARVGGEWVSL